MMATLWNRKASLQLEFALQSSLLLHTYSV